MTYLDPGFGDYIQVGNSIVERKAHDIVVRVMEYDPNLLVLAVDPGQCTFSEAPYVLGEVVGDQVFKVFEFWQLDDSLLERIYLSDTRRVDVLAMIDKNNAAVRREESRRYEEKREAAKDLVTSIVNSTKSTFTYTNDDGDLVKVHDDRPYEVVPKP